MFPLVPIGVLREGNLLYGMLGYTDKLGALKVIVTEINWNKIRRGSAPDAA